MEENKKEIKKYQQKIDSEIGEDSTKYGEFVSSYFRWITPEKQKQKTKEMEKMTDNQKEKNI